MDLSFLQNPALLWLLAGALLILVEVLTAPGIGLFLAGLGALCTGVLVRASSDMGMLEQAAWFFGFTIVWAALLWRPLRAFQQKRSSAQGYSNIVGETATVGAGGLKRGHVGQVAWSGTVMNAQIDPGAQAEMLNEGELVTIVSVAGTTLNVVPK